MTWDKFEELWQALWAYIYTVLEYFGLKEKDDEAAE